MPSVNVPLHGQPGWDVVQKQRRDFWAKGGNATIAEHFNVSEFHCHDGSLCPIVSRNALVRLCRDFLAPLRAKFGPCNVLSGYRHELYNARIGGARNSQHIYELTFEAVAADLRFPRGTPALWAAEAKKLRTKAGGDGGVGTYPKSGFVHVDNRNYKADWSG